MSAKYENSRNFSFTNDDVIKLKEFFKEEINSRRRFEEISTLEELVNVLEDRDALTDDVLSKLRPDFQDFVQSQRSKAKSTEELIIPQTVVKLISENCSDEWYKFGLHLKLSKEQMNHCQTVQDVLLRFRENSNGISPQEMTFRLNRALDKCGKGNLKSRIADLMGPQIS